MNLTFIFLSFPLIISPLYYKMVMYQGIIVKIRELSIIAIYLIIVFFHAGKRRNGKLPFWRKSQSKVTVVPSPGSHIQKSRSRLECTVNDENVKDHSISEKTQRVYQSQKIEQIPEDLLILRDRCFKVYLLFLFYPLGHYKRDSSCKDSSIIHHHYSKLTIVFSL